MLDALCLPLLGGATAALFVLAASASLLPSRAIAPAMAALCGVIVLLALAALAMGVHAEMDLPFGLGLVRGSLALDPVGAFFLLLPAAAGLAALVMPARAPAAFLPAVVASGMLLVLAGDAATAVIGVGLVGALTGTTMRSMGLWGLVLLATAFAILASGGHDSFAAMRAAPAEGWRAAFVLLAVLAGSAVVGDWRLREGVAPVLLLLRSVSLAYLLSRVLLDLGGPATPSWWGVALLLAGVAASVRGAMQALTGTDLGGVMAGFVIQHFGWITIGIGAALAARGADLLPLAALAWRGAMLHALSVTLSLSLAAMACRTAASGCGSVQLDRMGGLARGMTVTAAGMAVAGFSLAFLPLSAAFGGGWMLLQALFAVPRIGGWTLQMSAGVTVAAFALSAGLGMAAIVRLLGVALLGRPRTPRTAAAAEVARPQRIALLCLSAMCVALGLMPAMIVQLASGAQAVVTPSGLDAPAVWLGLHVQRDLPGYQPWAVLLPIAVVCIVGAVLVRKSRLARAEAVPAWEDGFAAPPAWMPFGDPATQITAGALAGIAPGVAALSSLMPSVDLRLRAQWPGLKPQPGMVLLAIAVALLTLLALAGKA